jgi:hypothetical protein
LVYPYIFHRCWFDRGITGESFVEKEGGSCLEN